MGCATVKMLSMCHKIVSPLIWQHIFALLKSSLNLTKDASNDDFPKELFILEHCPQGACKNSNAILDQNKC